MTHRWLKEAPMHPWSCQERVETWTAEAEAGGERRAFQVEVRLGKPVDIFGLKQNMVADYAGKLEAITSRSRAVFASGRLERVPTCPICAAGAEQAREMAVINGGRYLECPACGHCFVGERPTPEALASFYHQDEGYAATYTDPATDRLRMEQVALPKARWVADTFARLYGRKPRLILDVGAGGGHFVAACRQLGLEARGLELSAPSRRHASASFGLELVDADFLADWPRFTGADVVTFWAVLEHLPRPLAFLRAARELLPAEGLTVAEVPRWQCLSAALQISFPQAVCRHLEPSSHIHIFSDNSLLTAFDLCGFSPRAAWYFGMDAYELIMQLCLALGDEAPARLLGPHQPQLQRYLDSGELSDEIVLAGAPAPKP